MSNGCREALFRLILGFIVYALLAIFAVALWNGLAAPAFGAPRISFWPVFITAVIVLFLFGGHRE